MDKTTLTLIAALGAALPIGSAAASVSHDDARRALQATSIAELLEPVPNAVGVMKALADMPEATDGNVETAQLYFGFGEHHHHHHHHEYYRRRHHHHHHHHHWHHHHHHHHYNDEY